MIDTQQLVSLRNELKERRLIYNNTDFAQQIGRGRSYVSEALNGRRPITEQFALSIADAFPQVSRDWLLSGEGEMMLSNISNAEVYIPEAVMEVPVIPYTARAGALGDYEQICSSDAYDTLFIPSDKIRKGKYLIFSVGGESMEETLYHGDKVLARLVQRHLWESSKLHIRQWSVWIIITRTEGILIKNIIEHNVKSHKILLHSYNTIYPDFWVDLEDVIDIYNVVELISRKL